MPYLDIDLYKVIRSGQELTDEHIQYMVYQILKGLKYLHSAGIVHRDLKPSNLLGTERTEIKMCDFGLSRKIEDEQKDELEKQISPLTEYVVTRFYRAPEIMLSSHEYSLAVDLWSLGCTLAELLQKQILFKAKDYIKQIKLIFDTLGKPSGEDLKFITNENAKKYVLSLPEKKRVSVKEFINYENEDCLDLLDKLLEINPAKRITAEEALKHKYFESLHDDQDEPQFEGTIDFKFEVDPNITLDQLRRDILAEVNHFKAANQEPVINLEEAIKLVELKRKVLQ